MTCSGGTCSPTAAKAVLNVGDLESLLASGAVTVTTTGSGVQAGDIRVDAPLSWSSTNTLTLNAYQSIEIDQQISALGAGGITLNTQPGVPLYFNRKGRITFADLASPLTVNNTYYTLVNNIATLAADIANNPRFPGGNYALANDYDASIDGTYASPPIADYETGTVLGLGNAISNLAIDDPTPGANVGLFAFIGEAEGPYVLSLKLAHVNVKGGDGSSVGGMVGYSYAHLQYVSVSGRVRGGASSYVGGLVGQGEQGLISNSNSSAMVSGSRASFVGGLGGNGSAYASYATGKVRGGKNATAGGLIGDGYAQDSFATGSVSAGSGSYVGGFAGSGSGFNSYATGMVTGGNDSLVGGFVGFVGGDDQPIYSDPTAFCSYSTGKTAGGTGSYVGGYAGELAFGASDAYWDTTTSGTNVGVGHGNASGVTGLTTAQFQSGLPAGFSKKIWHEDSNINGGLPYLRANPPPS